MKQSMTRKHSTLIQRVCLSCKEQEKSINFVFGFMFCEHLKNIYWLWLWTIEMVKWYIESIKIVITKIYEYYFWYKNVLIKNRIFKKTNIKNSTLIKDVHWNHGKQIKAMLLLLYFYWCFKIFSTVYIITSINLYTKIMMDLMNKKNKENIMSTSCCQ